MIDEHATVTAVRRGNAPGAPRVGFITHIDTVDVGLSPDIHPQILRFNGEDLCLNGEKNIWLRVAEHPEILAYPGEEIIFSDGTSVLGADNKAAVTVVMTLLGEPDGGAAPRRYCRCLRPPMRRSGCAARRRWIWRKRFNVDFAWTIDCCELGRLSMRTLTPRRRRSASPASTAHPMSAKGVLVNPLLMATDYISLFDRLQTPEHTAGTRGLRLV
ncbi:Peptidase T [Pluralibacter gergoviae]|nr:Peptidase T [Pluralibacter gergoviae]